MMAGDPITDVQAIALAEAAIAGKVARAEDAPIAVARQGDDIVVTFVHLVPPGTLGADYDAQVTISGRSGQVTDLRVGA